jgi:hypothetical protein
MNKSQNTFKVSLSIEEMLSTLIRWWREKSVKIDCRRNISGSVMRPDSSIEEMLLNRLLYQTK